MPNDPAALKAACDDVLADPDFAPGNGVTHCNQALAAVGAALGCRTLFGLLADEIYARMSGGLDGWHACDGVAAAAYAAAGGLAVAALPSTRLQEAHGHVAAIYPVEPEYSPSLKKDVPVVANVGRTVGVMKASEAFPVAAGEPDYFYWTAEAP